MRGMLWLILLAALAVVGYAAWLWRKRWRERQQAEEERMAAFMAQARPMPPPIAATTPVDASLPQQKLLLEAAAKAGEAGEPVLSIQLYARLLARYPASAFAPQARTAVETQKQKLKLAKP